MITTSKQILLSLKRHFYTRSMFWGHSGWLNQCCYASIVRTIISVLAKFFIKCQHMAKVSNRGHVKLIITEISNSHHGFCLAHYNWCRLWNRLYYQLKRQIFLVQKAKTLFLFSFFFYLIIKMAFKILQCMGFWNRLDEKPRYHNSQSTVHQAESTGEYCY